MHPPLAAPLLSLSAPLLEQLKRRTNALRSKIVRTNYGTQFAQTALELADFRNATVGLIDEMDEDTLYESFRKTVCFTTYDSYAPLIAKFFEEPCKESSITDLLAPGLPDYLARSTSTSGGLPKFLPLYSRLSKITPSSSTSWTVSDPLRRRTAVYISLWERDAMHIKNDNNCLVKTTYLTGVSVVNRRIPLNLHPDKDHEKMATFILDHAAPYAVGFIKKYRSYLLIHALFSVGSKFLETMTIPYTSVFVDLMHLLDTEYDLLVECIAGGTIPDVDGVANVRHYLEMNISPDPERAVELRSLGRPSLRPGWCSRAWPKLHSVTTTASGSFATYIQSTKWFLGPNIDIYARGYGSTEAAIAYPYNPLELNQYKLNGQSVMEFLDVGEGDSISALAQPWEVKPGSRYEIVLTTQDGLWRYRLGDVVEIYGFDPTDGVPIIEFIERRNVALRFDDFMITEKELGAAILSMVPNTSAQMIGWTSVVDDRYVPATIGFFVELFGHQGLDVTLAVQRVVDELLRSNENIAYAIKRDSFQRPTIRLVQPGTFSKFLQLKLDEGRNHHFGQVKVPAVLSNAAHISWFSSRVVQEI